MLVASRYAFLGITGYILPHGKSADGLVAFGHTALVPPWTDLDVHRHETAEEYFFLRQGTLRFWIAGLGSRHRSHLHEQSWEYYVVLEGTKTLLVEDQQVTLQPGELLEVPPGVEHTPYSLEALYKGLTFRVAVLDDKVEGR